MKAASVAVSGFQEKRKETKSCSAQSEHHDGDGEEEGQSLLLPGRKTGSRRWKLGKDSKKQKRKIEENEK